MKGHQIDLGENILNLIEFFNALLIDVGNKDDFFEFYIWRDIFSIVNFLEPTAKKLYLGYPFVNKETIAPLCKVNVLNHGLFMVLLECLQEIGLIMQKLRRECVNFGCCELLLLVNHGWMESNGNLVE